VRGSWCQHGARRCWAAVGMSPKLIPNGFILDSLLAMSELWLISPAVRSRLFGDIFCHFYFTLKFLGSKWRKKKKVGVKTYFEGSESSKDDGNWQCFSRCSHQCYEEVAAAVSSDSGRWFLEVCPSTHCCVNCGCHKCRMICCLPFPA